MKNQLVYDLPLRIFHWLFAALFVSAFFIAKTIDSESVAFSYHMLLGLVLGFIVILRVFWGIVGTKHSRIVNFPLHPADLMIYFKGVLFGGQKKWSGHNPASSWGAMAMFGFALGLAITGYLMASGQEEDFEDIHELLANGFLIVTIIHIAGLILHMFRHRDRIVFSMVDGSKQAVPPGEEINQSRPVIAFLFLSFVAAFVFYLVSNFDQRNQSLKFFGTELHLGDGEEVNF